MIIIYFCILQSLAIMSNSISLFKISKLPAGEAIPAGVINSGLLLPVLFTWPWLRKTESYSEINQWSAFRTNP